ncbi:catalase [Sistotremastrum suecicum HHB10207 ss-3]|uniref:Catalase n=1 Tax=Sistotremastrum suecicum HHB10207 ss-3 TaxID=1314776 RepID=A0A165ZKD5_9AGAM|nr:catalase [Sistotremastrum suecicum HHB10207 ss-3]
MPSEEVFNTPDGATYTTSNGDPIAEPYAVQRIGHNGPVLLQDFHHIDLLAHFDRERIPERVVHAKAAGAHGYFEVTHDISDLTCAALFNKVGKRARVTARLSTVAGEAGSADTVRDVRGFSVKLRTEEGNWDWVFNNTPVFFFRDPSMFPHFVHTQKRDPQTHRKDADMFWDFFSQVPESIHQLLILFGDRGIPDGYHHMNGYSSHTYKFVNAAGDIHYYKMHCLVEGGFRTLDSSKAAEIAGQDPDYGLKTMYNAIDKGHYPVWNVFVQTMTIEQAESFRYNILDMTKIWPHAEYPLRPIGKFVLNENPKNYFAEIEQAAFSPSHLIPGVEASTDPVLQSRLFAYPDTQRYRLGVNYQQLPVNAPIAPIANFQRDGSATFVSQGNRPNYKSSNQPLSYIPRTATQAKHEIWLGQAAAELSSVTELDFEQARTLWNKVFDDGARERLVKNVSDHIRNVKSESIKRRQLSIFAAVEQTLSDRIADLIDLPHVTPLRVPDSSAALKYRVSPH